MNNNVADRLSKLSFYPLAEKGPLCPYLDDADHLFQLLLRSSHRQTFKKFCKAKEWPGKPNNPKVMTDEALKLLFLSACNSADARYAMTQFEGAISLHRIIYDSILVQSLTIHEACLKKLTNNQGDKRKNCLTPEMFCEVIAEHATNDQHKEALHLLALSLAMLQQKQAVDYISELLRYFPDSTASMGCLDEEDSLHGSDIESMSNEYIIEYMSQSETGVFSCTLEHTEELSRQCQNVKSAFDEYQKTLTKISASRDLEAFSQKGLIDKLIHTLAHEREIITKSGGEIGKILKVECRCPDEIECAFAKKQNEFRQFLPTQVEHLIAATSQALEIANSVEKSGESARAILPSLEFEAKRYLRQLGQPNEEDIGNTELKLPCEAMRLQSLMQKRVDRLKEELDARLVTERGKIEACLNAMTQTASHFTTPVQSLCNAKIGAIQQSLCVVKDIQAIDECWSQLKSLEDIMRDASSKLESNAIRNSASRLQFDRDNTLAFIELCEALLDSGLNKTALLVHLVRQHVHSIEEIVGEPDRAIGALVEAVCRIKDDQGNLPYIWHALCASPWLLAIRRNDLTSTDLIECLAVMYVADAISGNAEHSAVGLLNLGVNDRSDLSLPPSINTMIEAIISYRSFHVVAASTGSRIGEMRKEIEECIAFDNGKYRHIQCGKATHFARFEAIKIFPELELFWKNISTAVAGRRVDDAHRIAYSIDPDEWIDQMIKSHDRDMHPHPHFSGKIQLFVTNFVQLVREYIDECEGLTRNFDIVIDEQFLQQELTNWAGNNTSRKSIKKHFPLQAPDLQISFGRHDLVAILLSSQEVISSCPSAVIWSLSQRLIQPNHDFEFCIINDLGQAHLQDEIDGLLSAHQGWGHLKNLWQGHDHGRELIYAKKEKEARSELQQCRQKIIEYSQGKLVEVFDACCENSRFEAALGIVDECRKHLDHEFSKKIESIKLQVNKMFDELERLKELAEEKGMSNEWVDSIYSYASGVERLLKKLQRTISNRDQNDDYRLSHLEDALRALTVVVNERSNNFDAVKFHLEGGNLNSIAPHGQVVSEQEAYAHSPDLLDAWATLRSCKEEKVHSAWVAFVKLFGKLCNLYHDEYDPYHRFTPVTPFDYPHSTYQTAFYKPKSEFLKRPLRFYLYRDDVDNQARQRLDVELSEQQSATWLHLIFAPSGSDKLRKSFQLDKKFRSVLVIDDAFLYRICVEEKHDVPIRRGLHGVVADLVSSSPFVANGYCHQENNIYVGRSEVIQRLLNHPQAMIWGGRRIGKTSVLHALESTLIRRHYHVALVYADVHGSDNPDLTIAQRLTVALDLPPVNSVSEFVTIIQAKQKDGIKFAFLLDEVDEYIKKSRLSHDGEFPLASGLRQIVMEDPSKSTVLVYSGYHQLYFEAKLDKSKKRVGHPFVNIASDFPIRDLSHNDVIELVKTGFEEMLGIDLHPDVPSLIAEKASCHPAFVQEFCRCLLGHVSRRRPNPQSKIIIMPKDVEEVYRADGHGDGGEQPFIFYVDETLGYNLSDLGRAIMLTIATDKFYSKDEIYNNLCEYADAAEIELPRADHFGDTIDLLVMTNLLTQDANRNDYYRMTYPTFIEILGRLNKLGKTEIENSLKSYDQNERNKGVLR